MMLYFQRIDFQISPRLNLVVSEPLADSNFGLSLDLAVSDQVSCLIQRYEDGMEIYKTKLDNNHCGIVEIDHSNTYCHITLFVTAEQFDYFVKSINAACNRLRHVGISVVLNPNFQTLRNRVAYQIEKNPMITVSMANA
jgi:hypothetical protein